MGNGVTAIHRNQQLEDLEVNSAIDALVETAVKNENAIDILDWEQGVKEIKSIRRAMKILDIGYEEALEKPTLRNRSIHKNTNRSAFDFKKTITTRYASRRKKNRQRRRILHILVFPYVARKMTTLKDWRELYCVCKAWRDLLSDENVWRKRLVYLQPKSLHLNSAAFNLEDYHEYVDNTIVEQKFSNDQAIWKPLSYRKLSCSKLAMMNIDPNNDGVFEWPWDKEIMSIYALQLVSTLTNLDRNLKCSVLGKHLDVIAVGKGGYRQQTQMFNVSLTDGEIEFPRLRKVLDRFRHERDGGEQGSKKCSADESKLERVNECIHTFSAFSRDASNASSSLSIDFRYELLPMIKILGKRKVFNYVYLLVSTIDEFTSPTQKPIVFQSPRSHQHDYSMISRLSFSFQLLSKIMKLFVTSNEWVKLTWLGENTLLSSKFGVGGSRRHESASDIFKRTYKEKMYTQKVINSMPRLKEVYGELESPQAQFTYLQNCFALVNRHGYIFFLIHVRSGYAFLPRMSTSGHSKMALKQEEVWAKSIEKRSLWNAFVQNKSQSLRLSENDREDTLTLLYHHLILKITKHQIPNKSSGNRKVRPKLIEDRWHDAIILAFAHGNLVKNYQGKTGVLVISSLNTLYRLKFDIESPTSKGKGDEEDITSSLRNALSHTNVTVVDDDEKTDKFQSMMSTNVIKFRVHQHEHEPSKTI